jgi:hypothetical protein
MVRPKRAKGRIVTMKLALSNRHLQDKTKAKAGLIASARTSSGVEGIRQAFERAVQDISASDSRAFVMRWKQRAASKSAQ